MGTFYVDGPGQCVVALTLHLAPDQRNIWIKT
jgi:hypothetical protein